MRVSCVIAHRLIVLQTSAKQHAFLLLQLSTILLDFNSFERKTEKYLRCIQDMRGAVMAVMTTIDMRRGESTT